MGKLIEKKKGVMGQVINIFILILIISVLAGMTFLFVSQLKEEVLDTTATETITITNETGILNSTGYRVSNATDIGFRGFTIVYMNNATGNGEAIASTDYVITSDGFIFNGTGTEIVTNNVNITFTFARVPTDKLSAYNAVNKTETAGYNTTKYLTLLFLALIFGAILIVVLRVMLPYINVGRSMGGGF